MNFFSSKFWVLIFINLFTSITSFAQTITLKDLDDYAYLIHFQLYCAYLARMSYLEKGSNDVSTEEMYAYASRYVHPRDSFIYEFFTDLRNDMYLVKNNMGGQDIFLRDSFVVSVENPFLCGGINRDLKLELRLDIDKYNLYNILANYSVVDSLLPINSSVSSCYHAFVFDARNGLTKLCSCTNALNSNDSVSLCHVCEDYLSQSNVNRFIFYYPLKSNIVNSFDDEFLGMFDNLRFPFVVRDSEVSSQIVPFRDSIPKSFVDKYLHFSSDGEPLFPVVAKDCGEFYLVVVKRGFGWGLNDWYLVTYTKEGKVISHVELLDEEIEDSFTITSDFHVSFFQYSYPSFSYHIGPRGTITNLEYNDQFPR